MTAKTKLRAGRKRPATRRAAEYEGLLQGVGNGVALGWAANRADPDARVPVAIVVDGEIVAEGVADEPRADLAEMALGDGAHGFLIELPEQLQTPARRRIVALAGAEQAPLTPAPSFWHKPAAEGAWSDVIFEPGGALSAKVPEAPARTRDARAICDGGWLFLEGGWGRGLVNEEWIANAVAALTSNARACEALGIMYVPALVPDKREVVMGSRTEVRRGLAALRARLREADEVELMDLLGVLRDCKRGGSPYHRTDADWNDRGAFFVARALLKEAHKRVPALSPPAMSELHVRAVPGYRGTLADAPKLTLEDGELVSCDVEVPSEPGIALDPSRLRALRMPVEQRLAQAGNTHLRVYATPERDEEARVAVVGDEAALSLVPWLAERTSRTTFFYSRELPLAQLEVELPRVLFHVLREADLPLERAAAFQADADLPAGAAPRADGDAPAGAAPGVGGDPRADADTQPDPAPATGARPPEELERVRAPASALAPLWGLCAMALRDLAGTAGTSAARAGAALRAHAWTLALVGLLTALSWPLSNVRGGAGLDESWAVGLNLAVAHGLAFGRQVIFTYGPLGFGLVPRAVTPGTFLAGEVLGGLIQLALVAVLLANLRRRMNLLAASVLTLLAASLVGWIEAQPLSAIAFGMVALTFATPAARRERTFRRLAIGGGAFAGFAMLVKLNDGAATSAVLALGLLGSDRRARNLARAAASMLGTLVALWLLAGEPLGALPDYLRNSYQVIGGYVEAMGVAPSAAIQWQALLVAGSALALAFGAWRALETERPRRGAALAAAVLAIHYFAAREAFVRYGPGHVAVIAVLGAVALMIPWPRAQRASGLALAALLMVATFAVLARPVREIVDPLGDAGRLVSQVHEVLHPAALIEEGRQHVRGEDAVPKAMARSLRGHCVSAEPDEIASVWAHPKWHWCPLPVFQSYTAYTPRLDELNAAAYADARRGPDRVLRQVNQAIDGRNSTWESPAAMLSLLCHFTEMEHSGEWQTLARVPDRCGAPYPLQTIHSSLGHTIALPSLPENAVMVAAIDGVQVAGWERLETLFMRARARFVTVNDGQSSMKFRVPPGTADDGLVLWVPPKYDYPAPFNLRMDPRTVKVEVEGHGSGPIAVRLFAVPIR